MTNELICTWLGLPSDSWPPDHYRLLDLDPGKSDPTTVEHQVHQRLEAVRRYQLTHPEQATEAMNRLAQAFVCLTDPESKRVYDAALFGTSRGAVTVANPPPVRRRLSKPSAASAEDPVAGTELDTAAATASAPVAPEAAVAPPGTVPPIRRGPSADGFAEELKPDHAIDAARLSAAARRGLGSRRALYRRLAITRRLMKGWERAGKYMADPGRRIARPNEATEFLEQLTRIQGLLRSFPPLLGEAGHPGYLVIALARLQVVVPTFQTLLLSQREALARDWQAGIKVLAEHRLFLRAELRALRRGGRRGRALRWIRALLTDQPVLVLILAGLLLLNLFLWGQYLAGPFPREPVPKSAR